MATVIYNLISYIKENILLFYENYGVQVFLLRQILSEISGFLSIDSNGVLRMYFYGHQLLSPLSYTLNFKCNFFSLYYVINSIRHLKLCSESFY